jgi:ARG/rhodanese/phosphatase superfamily protein
VSDATGAYVRDLKKVIEGKPDVVGYAFAINGKVNSADLYASGDLFRKMWPKLLNASAVEAFTERPKAGPKTGSPTSPTADIAAVQSAIAGADRGRESSQAKTGRVSVVKKESDQVLLFESREAGRSWIHKSYVVK